MRKRTDNRTGGFTLIELMVALAIMAFGILGYTFLQHRAIQARVFSREMNRATAIAQEFLEQLMALPYNHDLLADAAGDTQPTLHPASGSGVTREGKQWILSTVGNFRYYTRWEVTAGIPTSNIKMINIYTAWEKKNPDTGALALGGYNVGNPRPTLRSFKR